MRKLNVLIACEESQAICKEFRRLGHIAYSCDIQDESGGHPEWHIKGDAFDVVDGNCRFTTKDGTEHVVYDWDLVIAHPPCTYLSKSGERWLDVEKYGKTAEERLGMRYDAASFFLRFTTIRCSHVAIENPVGCMSRIFRKEDQIIQPWWFGDPVKKSTCLWLKGLPALVPEVTDEPEIDVVEYTDRYGVTKTKSKFFFETRYLPADERRRQRSKTFPGIARAIAAQWSEYLQSV